MPNLMFVLLPSVIVVALIGTDHAGVVAACVSTGEQSSNVRTAIMLIILLNLFMLLLL